MLNANASEQSEIWSFWSTKKKCRTMLMSKILRTWESSNRRKIQRQSYDSRLNPSCELTAEQWVSAYSVSSWSCERSYTGINLWLYTGLIWLNLQNQLLNQRQEEAAFQLCGQKNHIKKLYDKYYCSIICECMKIYIHIISYHIMLVTYYKSYL